MRGSGGEAGVHGGEPRGTVAVRELRGGASLVSGEAGGAGRRWRRTACGWRRQPAGDVGAPVSLTFESRDAQAASRISCRWTTRADAVSRSRRGPPGTLGGAVNVHVGPGAQRPDARVAQARSRLLPRARPGPRRDPERVGESLAAGRGDRYESNRINQRPPSIDIARPFNAARAQRALDFCCRLVGTTLLWI